MFAGGSPRTNETLRYLGSRLVTTVLIVIGAMLLLFTLSAVVPGDPATTLLGPQATPELSRRFITEMGLDQPLPIRLWRFFANVATGNLGVDVISGRSVAGLIGEVLPVHADPHVLGARLRRADRRSSGHLRGHASRLGARQRPRLRLGRLHRGAELRHRDLPAPRSSRPGSTGCPCWARAAPARSATRSSG